MTYNSFAFSVVIDWKRHEEILVVGSWTIELNMPHLLELFFIYYFLFLKNPLKLSKEKNQPIWILIDFMLTWTLFAFSSKIYVGVCYSYASKCCICSLLLSLSKYTKNSQNRKSIIFYLLSISCSCKYTVTWLWDLCLLHSNFTTLSKINFLSTKLCFCLSSDQMCINLKLVQIYVEVDYLLLKFITKISFQENKLPKLALQVEIGVFQWKLQNQSHC